LSFNGGGGGGGDDDDDDGGGGGDVVSPRVSIGGYKGAGPLNK
jgi:hypothetical protein